VKIVTVACADTLLNAHGQYTTNTINRAGKMVGAVATAIDAAFHHNVCQTDVDDSYTKRYNYAADVATFCKDYASDRLFAHIPGRQHSAFPDFMPVTSVHDPSRLKGRLLKYSRRLDQLHVMHGRFK